MKHHDRADLRPSSVQKVVTAVRTAGSSPRELSDDELTSIVAGYIPMIPIPEPSRPLSGYGGNN